MNDIVEFSSLRKSGGLEEPRQCASWLAFSTKGSLESADKQRVVTTSETKELTLPAVPRPPLPESGEEVV